VAAHLRGGAAGVARAHICAVLLLRLRSKTGRTHTQNLTTAFAAGNLWLVSPRRVVLPPPSAARGAPGNPSPLGNLRNPG
jgi:hypothetical protein